MRPKTSASGIFSTNRNRPVSTNMLTRILVPKPKKAFQSPGAHKTGRKPAVDVVVGLAANEDAAHRAGGADAVFRIAALDLVRRRIGQIGPMPFAGVDDQHVEAARSCKHRLTWRDGGLQPRHVITERGAETAG